MAMHTLERRISNGMKGKTWEWNSLSTPCNLKVSSSASVILTIVLWVIQLLLLRGRVHQDMRFGAASGSKVVLEVELVHSPVVRERGGVVGQGLRNLVLDIQSQVDTTQALGKSDEAELVLIRAVERSCFDGPRVIGTEVDLVELNWN